MKSPTKVGPEAPPSRRAAVRSYTKCNRVGLEQLCLQNSEFCLLIAGVIVRRYETNLIKPLQTI